MNVQLKIICGQPEIIPGRPDANYEKILAMMEEARQRHADILLLPEMALPGYLIGDLWEQQSFLDDCAYYTQKIAAASRGLCVLFGSVALEPGKVNEDGRVRKYNAAFACQDGKLLGGYLGRDFLIKNSLPSYREFDDDRYFYSLQKLCAEEGASVQDALQPLKINIRGKELRLGVMLCEDGWTENYFFNVPRILAANGAQILCNLSCSPYTLGKNRKRERLFGAQAREAGIPLLYCNNVGVQNNGKNIFTYDGCSSVYDAVGTLLASTEMFAETLLEIRYDTERRQVFPAAPVAEIPAEARAIYLALKYGAARFLRQCGIERMTIGLSGGIDSAVAAALYADILGPEKLLLLNLPSRYNSQLTRSSAERLARNLGANYAVLPITESFELTQRQLTQTPIRNFARDDGFYLQLSGLVKENIQARDRGARLIAAAAAAFGGAFSCNSNKAELAIGYATFYGDIAGALAILGDLWKYQVYALGEYLNKEVFQRDVIPAEIFSIRPSAELSDSQTVGQGGDPLHYPYHDYLFRAWIENWHKATPTEILRWYKDGTLARELGCAEDAVAAACPDAKTFIADLERWWKLFAGFSVAKRIQAPPILSLTKRAFGYDHRESQLAPYFSREYYVLKKELLDQ